MGLLLDSLECGLLPDTKDIDQMIGLLQAELDHPDELTERFREIDEEEALLFHSSSITIVHVSLSPNVEFPPHDHNMPALIGIYRGQERHRWYRQSGEQLEEVGSQLFSAGEIVQSRTDSIHSVSNIGTSRSAALHIYFGDLLAQARSVWNPDTSERVPYSDAMYFRWARLCDDRRPGSLPKPSFAHSRNGKR
jgi:predicted metal-dependent enzyme (double-stranded beta helix superfamily)